jgi:hypothetical protein
MIVEVFLSERLRVRKADLPLGHESQIKQRLTVPNGDKVAALKRNQWGADDLPDSFALYQDDGAWLVMPRGYAAELCAGLEHSGHSVRLVDKTSATSLLLDEFVHHGPTLRDDQEKACMALLHARQGVLEAPTSGGKTVTVLEAWRRSGLRGLILVEKTGLAKQWIERAGAPRRRGGHDRRGRVGRTAAHRGHAANALPPRSEPVLVAALGIYNDGR